MSRFACHFPRVELEVNELEGEEDELTRVNSRFCLIFIFDRERAKWLRFGSILMLRL